jgi:plasmid maintenance system antidote protein VapI
LKRELAERGISTYKCAKLCGFAYSSKLYELQAERVNLSPALAIHLSKTLGDTAENWMLVQVRYDLHRARIELGFE